VNRWPWIDAETVCRANYLAGCTFILLEGVPWFPSNSQGSLSDYTKYGRTDTLYPEALLRWAAAARKYQLTLAVTLCNWNSEAVKRKGREWYVGAVAWLRANVAQPGDRLPTGAPVLMIEPVSEPESRAIADERLAWVQSAWPGGALLVNGAGGRGDAAGGMLDYHHCSEDSFFRDTKGPDHLNSLDCGPVINLPLDTTRKMIRHTLHRETTFLYYGFDNRDTMGAILNVLREEIQKGGRGTKAFIPVSEE